MKTSATLRTLCVCLLTVMLVGTGCDKLGLGGKGGETTSETTSTDTTDTTPTETNNTDTTPPPETTAETTGSETTGGETTGEAKKFDKAQFLNAYYEQTCVSAKVLETEKQQTILNEVYPRYGFKNKEEFEAARAQFKDEPDVKIVLEERMKGCTKEAALAFERNGAANVQAQAKADMGAPDMGAPDMGKVEVKKVVKPAAPAFVGNYTARGVAGGGVQRGSLSIRVSKTKSFTGFFSGQRDGKRFNIPLRGSVTSSGSLSGNGKQGANNVVSLRGNINGKNLNATISGTLNAQRVNIPLTAKR